VSATNINRVTLTGNLTRDPELRSLQSGTSVCSLRIASNSRRKTADGWVDKPNYFSVTVWGAQGENCHRFLSKGRPVAIDGRLDWREWTGQDDIRRESIEIIADSVQFLGSAHDTTTENGTGRPPHDDDDEPRRIAVAGADDDEDDIPF
jgi:single-strand DNA-binding protein